tara:strand:- start:17355 stop:17723 length:369 start_codon:yes stop_codon:yes gene_type:complete
VKVCVIEDNRDMRRLLELLLASKGYEVESYGDGLTALNSLKAEEKLPEIIFVDNYMPICSGPEFRKLQVLDKRLSHIKTFLLTASLDFDSEEYTSAFDGCISKVMINSNKLADVIESHTRIH